MSQINTATQVTLPSDTEIQIIRVFEAPRDLLWKVFTTAEHLTHWWGPREWTLPVCEVDFRPGGLWLYCMQGPEGEQSCGRAVYKEITAPERYVYTDYFADAEGNAIPGMPEAQVTMEFVEQGARTQLVNTTRYNTKADRDRVLQMGVTEGASETMDRLAEYVATIR